MLLSISFISFESSIKALESLKFFDLVLSRSLMENCYFARYESLAYKYIS